LHPFAFHMTRSRTSLPAAVIRNSDTGEIPGIVGFL
jgi:hypothetical protein